MAIDQALCRSKARFMYDVPVEHSCAAPLILIFCAIWVLSFLVEFVTHRNMPVENSTPPTAHTRAKQFAINTVLLVLDGFFFAMAVLGLLKTYYCIDEPRWDGWNDDWIAAGFLGGLPLFCALSNWLKTLVNLVLCRWDRFLTGKQWPPALGVILLLGSIPILVSPFLALGAAIYVVRRWTATPSSGQDSERDIEMLGGVAEDDWGLRSTRTSSIVTPEGTVVPAQQNPGTISPHKPYVTPPPPTYERGFV
ncbi:hypothetical protein BJ546DRAFT_489101 [Cryomyces antarcticus]|nr:hypothetical protein LTR39_000208 [Cryomyces antarcticus]